MRIDREWVLAAGEAYKKASGRDDWFLTDIEAALAAVAPLIAQAEREACARIADQHILAGGLESWQARRIATAIRARSTEVGQ